MTSQLARVVDAAMLAAVAAAIGCSEPQNLWADVPYCEIAGPCAADTDCLNRYTSSEELLCESGRCIVGAECSIDGECARGRICVEGTWGLGLFTRRCVAGVRCAVSSDCAASEDCVDGQCRLPRCTPGSCGEGSTCVDGGCRAIECGAVGAECGAAEACIDGVCLAVGCDPECPEGFGCANLAAHLYACLPRCGSDCDCVRLFPPGGTTVCIEGYCVPVDCIDGADFGCGVGLECRNARETIGYCP